eukprot:1161190-Pelagomonas_calceolata.AAC.9
MRPCGHAYSSWCIAVRCGGGLPGSSWRAKLHLCHHESKNYVLQGVGKCAASIRMWPRGRAYSNRCIAMLLGLRLVDNAAPRPCLRQRHVCFEKWEMAWFQSEPCQRFIARLHMSLHEA